MVEQQKKFNVHGFTCHRQDRPTTGGGVAIFIKDDIPHRGLPLTTTLEAVAIEVSINDGQSISFCKIYHTERKLDETLLLLLHRQLPGPTILCGDFNSHHAAWGSRKTNRKGINLLSFSSNSSVTILNDGSGTHVIHTCRLTAIDLTLVSDNLAPKFNWTVDHTTALGSDHYPIFTTVNRVLHLDQTAPPKRFNLKKADWESFSAMCTEKLNDSLHSLDVNTFNRQITDVLILCAENSIPKSTPSNKNRGYPGGQTSVKQRLPPGTLPSTKCDKVETRTTTEYTVS